MLRGAGLWQNWRSGGTIRAHDCRQAETTNMTQREQKIYGIDHPGMVDGAIVRTLMAQGSAVHNIIGGIHTELYLGNQQATLSTSRAMLLPLHWSTS